VKFKEQPWRAIGALILIVAFINEGLAVDIDTEVNDPIATSTANAGAPDDINIVSGGAVVITDDTNDFAVRVDSDNNLNNLNVISFQDADDVTGVYIEGGHTTSFTSGGSINLSEAYVPVDLDDDGDVDGPLAVGTGKIGVYLDAAGPMIGDIDVTSFGSISVEGRNSAGIRLDSQLLGSLTLDGRMTVLGENSPGVDVRSGIDGNVLLSSSMQVQGENSIGVRLADGATGSFINEGSISTTGFTSNLRSNYRDPDSIGEGDTPITEIIDAEGLKSSGSAVSIGGSLGQGFLNNGIVDDIVDADEAADETKDTVEDFDENRSTGSISSVGDAPGVLISPDDEGDDAGDVVIGRVVENVRDTTDDDEDGNFTETAATFNYDYGVINRGSISVSGLNVGYSASALRIAGAPDGSRSVLIEGGIQNTRTISAVAFEANATALSLGAFAETDLLVNSGDIRAAASTNGTNQARAVVVEPNARLNTINNIGGIIARVNATDSGGTAVGILDQSNTLTSILNRGAIQSRIDYLDSEVLQLGSAIAIDLSANSAATSVVQSILTPVDDLNEDGVINENDAVIPSIVGDVLFGSGDDSLDLQGGTLQATSVDFGAGNDSLILSNSSSFRSALSGVENVTVEDSTLRIISTDPVNLDQLSLSGSSNLAIQLDTEADFSAPRLSSTGQTSVAAASSISVEMDGPFLDQLNVQLIQAGTLVWGDGTEVPELSAPAIYERVVATSGTAVDLQLSAKSADSLGLGTNEANALPAFLSIAEKNETVGTALTSYYDQQALVDDFNLLFPDYSDSVLRFLATNLGLASSELGARLDKLRADQSGGWFDIGVSGFNQSATEAGVGYDGSATTIQVGFDLTTNDYSGFGLGLALRDGHADAEKILEQRTDWTVLDLGFYGSYHPGSFELAASANAGIIDRYAKRAVQFSGMNENLESDWGGNFFATSAQINYRANFAGRYFLAPSMILDYLLVNQDGYTEESDVESSLFALEVGSGEASSLSGTAMLRLGRYDAEYASDGVTSGTVPGVAQQLYVGYRSELNGSAYDAAANFLIDSDNSFGFSRPYANDDAMVFGASFDWSPEGTTLLSLGYSGEMSEDFMSHKVFFELRLRW
jgi:hypothetical protein